MWDNWVSITPVLHQMCFSLLQINVFLFQPFVDELATFLEVLPDKETVQTQYLTIQYSDVELTDFIELTTWSGRLTVEHKRTETI